MITKQNRLTQWSFHSGRAYADPFNDVALDVDITGPTGQTQRVPAYWAGGNTWSVRYASPHAGKYTYQSICSDEENPDLHDQTGQIEIAPYEGDHALYKRGCLQVSKDKRYLQHADGTPFFWYGDTWWMALCDRLAWPADFQTLVEDRVQKGFTVIQLVAGLFPDMPPFDERGKNEGGFAWEADFARINPAFFDQADQRIFHLVHRGLVPCILGCWGYYLSRLGTDKMKQHWRYLIARWGALPVTWCLAGEGSMPYYLSKTKEADRAALKTGWTEVARYVRATDPYAHPLTIHPSISARDSVDDPAVLDYDMLQTGHGDRNSVPNTLRRMAAAYSTQPTMPVLNGEVCYEGIGEACRQEVQRFMFWICLLNGACGHTYGANGIWQVNTKERPFGPSPHGRSWGDTPWIEAMQLPGSKQLGLSKTFLERYDWWQIEPHPEWVENHATPDDIYAPYAGGIAGVVRFVFLPSGVWNATLTELEDDVPYRAFLFDPITGQERDKGDMVVGDNNTWKLAETLPVFQDWVLVVEAK